jgi:hypothetical protein
MEKITSADEFNRRMVAKQHPAGHTLRSSPAFATPSPIPPSWLGQKAAPAENICKALEFSVK